MTGRRARQHLRLRHEWWPTCVGGTPTGAKLISDGEGHRVASTTSSNGAVISTTDYLAGGLEEVTTAGSTTTLTEYESVPGVCSVVIVGSGPSESISYIATDGLGSVSEALDGGRNVTAQQLYGPYGTGRFSLGSMPTSKGYTGQYADTTTGLDYYGARYYDPLVGQFTQADSAGDGLNRYAYVHDEPETATDPTGHFRCDDTGCKRGGGNGGAGGCTFDCKSSPSGGCQSENCGGHGCYSNCGGGEACQSENCSRGSKPAAGGTRKPTQGGVPNDAPWSWSDPGHHVVVYLRGPEYDPRYGWHFNLVIKLWDGPEVYNYHLYYNGAEPPDKGPCTCGGMRPDSQEGYLWKAVETLYSPNKMDGTVYWLHYGERFPVGGDLGALAAESASVMTNIVADNLKSLAASVGVDPATMTGYLAGTKEDGSDSYWASAQTRLTGVFEELWAIRDEPPPS